jgi:hypothetical protein
MDHISAYTVGQILTKTLHNPIQYYPNYTCRTDEYWGLFFIGGKIAMGALIIFLLRI